MEEIIALMIRKLITRIYQLRYNREDNTKEGRKHFTDNTILKVDDTIMKVDNTIRQMANTI